VGLKVAIKASVLRGSEVRDLSTGRIAVESVPRTSRREATRLEVSLVAQVQTNAQCLVVEEL
jgi:hypothetical protein